MANSVKITVSLPADLHRAIERRRRAHKQSRSQFVRDAVLSVLRDESDREAATRYVEGYRQQPEEEPEASATIASAATSWYRSPGNYAGARSGPSSDRRAAPRPAALA